MFARRAFVFAVLLSTALLAASASQSRPLATSAKAEVVGSGTTWQMTLTNTGTEEIRCMRAFAPSGVLFTKASGPTGTHLEGGSAFSNGSLNIAPSASVTFEFETTAQLDPSSPPRVNVSADCVKDVPAQVTVTILTAPPPDCQKEREAVAAAKARVSAAEEELRAASASLAAAPALLEKARDELTNAKDAARLSPVVALTGAIDDAYKAVKSADDAAADASIDHFRAQIELERAKAALAKAEQALKKCEGGSSRYAAGAGGTEAAAAACGAERVTLAGASARSAALAAAVKRLERTKLRPAEKRLHAAIAGLERALKAPAARKYRSKLAPALGHLHKADAILAGVVRRLDRLAKSAKAARAKAKKAKAALAKCLAQPSVGISEDDTWTWNTAIGKGNICINVRTKPAQASVSATLTGPGGYNASVSKASLHADGSAQIRGQITQPGDYTKTLVVYDASGKQTATATKTFTVAASPQNGPAATPACPQPTQ